MTVIPFVLTKGFANPKLQIKKLSASKVVLKKIRDNEFKRLIYEQIF